MVKNSLHSSAYITKCSLPVPNDTLCGHSRWQLSEGMNELLMPAVPTRTGLCYGKCSPPGVHRPAATSPPDSHRLVGLPPAPLVKKWSNESHHFLFRVTGCLVAMYLFPQCYAHVVCPLDEVGIIVLQPHRILCDARRDSPAPAGTCTESSTGTPVFFLLFVSVCLSRHGVHPFCA